MNHTISPMHAYMAAGAKARSNRATADSEVGVTQLVGSYHDSEGALRLIAVRRTNQQRHDVIELADDTPVRVLQSVYGDQAASAEHAFKVAGAQLTQARGLAA